MFIVCSYLSGSIGIVRKNVTKDAVMVCICIIIITHTIFFIIIAPVSHYRGTPRFWAFFGLFFLWVGMDGGRDGGRDGRTAGGALERNKKDALQRNSGIVLSPSCTLERNKESIKVVINGLI